MLDQQLEKALEESEFSHFGWTSLDPPTSLEKYKAWLDKGHHGSMDYLEDHLAVKSDPRSYFKNMNSVIVVGIDYIPHPKPIENFPLSSQQIAKYAQGEDYHHWLKSKLENFCGELRELFPSAEFSTLTDSGPFLEREYAQRSGLGWFGKNSCIINRKKGSFFLLGEIFTTMDLKKQWEVSHDHCGTCTACIDQCPTKAIGSDKTLDSKLCISYLTIETSEIPKESIRSQMGDWLFGCDICQSVCPWNQKVFKERANERKIQVDRQFVDELRWILDSSNKQIQKSLKGTALMRAAGNKLKRNALIVVANCNIVELRDSVNKFLEHHYLGELAQWCLDQLGPE